MSRSSINTHDAESQNLLSPKDYSEEATNSWHSTASLIVCAMAGVGVLGLPGAMNASGWLGIVLLLIVAAVSAYTGIILGKAIDETPRVKDYSEVGEEAFGIWGRRFAQFSVYLTLGGVAIIFLILLGILMSTIVPSVGKGFWTLVIGALIATPLAIALKSYGEIKIISWFGFAATASVVIVSCVLSLVFYYGDSYTANKDLHQFSTVFINLKTFAIGFSVFTFAFGATAIFPNIYIKMADKKKWTQAILGGYSASLALYTPIAIIGYLVYGNYLGNSSVSTILDAILTFDTDTGIIVKICSAVMIGHILSAFPIVVNPIFLVLEERFGGKAKYSEFVSRLIIRGVSMAVFIVVALFFPYFLSVMSLLSCISTSLSGFILPCIFYWRICSPGNAEKVLLVLIVVFGLVGSGVGIYTSLEQLVSDVKAHPNPFDGLFRFG